jgi:hypothetical protein
MYIRRKCYSSLYDDLYNDYLYDKYFSDLYDYDYYDQKEFAMSPTEMAKLLYRESRNQLGAKGVDPLFVKQTAAMNRDLGRMSTEKFNNMYKSGFNRLANRKAPRGIHEQLRNKSQAINNALLG